MGGSVAALGGVRPLVTGNQDLLVLSDDLPILTPAEFATKLRESR